MITLVLTEAQAEALYRAATNPGIAGTDALHEACRIMVDAQAKYLGWRHAHDILVEQLAREDDKPPRIGDIDLRTCLTAVRQVMGEE